MDLIVSENNENIKLIRKLSEKKYRKSYELFVVEGVTLVKSIPSSLEVHSLFIKESVYDTNKAIIDTFHSAKYLVDDKIFNKAAETDNPSGLIALVKLSSNECKAPLGKSLILDRISDPGNLGTIIRTAVATGYNDIYLINSSDPYSGKVVRASMGGIFNLRIYETNINELTNIMKGIEVIALDMGGVSIYNYKVTNKKIAIIIGNEANGISDELLKLSNAVISLPMAKESESLNAAVACGITMYILGR